MTDREDDVIILGAGIGGLTPRPNAASCRYPLSGPRSRSGNQAVGRGHSTSAHAAKELCASSGLSRGWPSRCHDEGDRLLQRSARSASFHGFETGFTSRSIR
jgi:hypothetical protein